MRTIYKTTISKYRLNSYTTNSFIDWSDLELECISKYRALKFKYHNIILTPESVQSHPKFSTLLMSRLFTATNGVK